MSIPPEILQRLRKSLDKATETSLPEPGAMTLTTCGASGQPSARTVLLRGLDARGLVFYTNLGSRKSRQILENPRVALCFYWPPLAEQVLIEGEVEPVDNMEADAYWKTRPRDSRIGAWASRQSEPLESRFAFLRRFVAQATRFGSGWVPRPSFWSGYRVIPNRIEFWINRPFRLHERLCFEREGDTWTRYVLYP
uniref:Pyridoxine/pyridoxamine 5'-phosphate oxidase n=2 Tax=unclassified Candidatus Kentrum TaxID=2643149 RepID=A0A451AVF0_9GAMM|nr:MAG: Pyridoxamine 5'-phosphate oxidase [Candidatus Kentron sp. LPFa]VFK13780.1 MAG: Pyridoxamine 5'-phosphate oxidase [Candidatus Kentron sp. LPFa]VFK27718.1 MAG: Pyridoxamine 5'-phosphate oxidase [Candidatus Kentron sp. LPFa]VFK60610.1 MAG: Pyridoxamine 5'-phosphate oxidase [Candidatus Kentron sp. UNK]VFK69877.1 MAG: Pyridoxamine 5'-phosphate oxidase [Candidatus Kentron sp. UNK]